MRLSFGKDQLPKIFVHRDENPFFRRSPRQKRSIARIGTTFARFNDIVRLLA